MGAMGLDVGDKRIGIAVSDGLGLLAQGRPTYHRVGKNADIQALHTLMIAEGIDTLVVGLPRNMNGTVGPQGEKARAFGEELAKRAQAALFFQDERLTSVEAERVLLESRSRSRKQKGSVDKVAASMILQSWLDSRSVHQEPVAQRYYAKKEREGKTLMANMESTEFVDIVELEDEEGQVVRFRHELTVEHKDELYAFVVPLEDEEIDDEDAEMVILRIIPGEEDDTYEGVDDEMLIEELYSIYLEAMDEEEDDGIG